MGDKIVEFEMDEFEDEDNEEEQQEETQKKKVVDSKKIFNEEPVENYWKYPGERDLFLKANLEDFEVARYRLFAFVQKSKGEYSEHKTISQWYDEEYKKGHIFHFK